ncbi:hypothetical protein MMC34_003124 [Xylographa carneopallida]|nr:hypothetical protein [Xylographa carneopallida]
MRFQTILLALATSAYAIPAETLLTRASGFSGVATFNDYQSQGKTVCYPDGGVKSPLKGFGASAVWGAAAGDLSKHVGKGLCTPWSASDPMSAMNCSGTTNLEGYQGPNCPTSKYCGTPTCYKVTNVGAFNHGTFASGGAISTGRSITVKIIDVCPTYHAQNYCAILSDKSLMNLEQHCESSSTDSLDIDTNAYAALTGKKGSQQHVNGDANLNINILPTPCP